MAVYFSVSPVRSFVFFFFHFSIFLLRVTLLHVWFGRCVSFRRQYYVNGAITLATVQTNSNGYDFLFLTLANGLYLLCMHLLHVQSKALLFRRVFFLSLSLVSLPLHSISIQKATTTTTAWKIQRFHLIWFAGVFCCCFFYFSPYSCEYRETTCTENEQHSLLFKQSQYCGIAMNIELRSWTSSARNALDTLKNWMGNGECEWEIENEYDTIRMNVM